MAISKEERDLADRVSQLKLNISVANSKTQNRGNGFSEIVIARSEERLAKARALPDGPVKEDEIRVEEQTIRSRRELIEENNAQIAKWQAELSEVEPKLNAVKSNRLAEEERQAEAARQQKAAQSAAAAAAAQSGNAITTSGNVSSTAPDDRFKNPSGVGAANSPGTSGTNSGDPSANRLQNAGLAPGGTANNPLPQRQVPVTVFTQSGPSLALLEDDWRVRVSLGTASKLFYKGNKAGIQSVLKNTDGVVFPYTPTIQVQHQARYGEQRLTHSNYASYFFEGSEVNAITVSGDFTVQTPEEGKYLLAAVTFFRSCTKMFFGKTNDQPLAGSPPPLVFLHGYGKYIFPAVPCVITQFQQTLPGEVDYLEVSHFIDEVNPTGFVNAAGKFKSEIQLLNSAVTRVPTSSQLSVTLQPVYSRKTLHDDFNLDRFASGELLIGRGGFI